MKLYKTEIHNWSYLEVYQRGLELYRERKVRDLRADTEADTVTLTGSVSGKVKAFYRCEVDFRCASDDSLSITDYYCECPASGSWRGMCKHCVALSAAYSEQLKQIAAEATVAPKKSAAQYKSDSRLTDIINRYSAHETGAAELKPGSLHIELLFDRVNSYYGAAPYNTVELRAGAERLYVIRSVSAFVHSVIHGTRYEYAKKLSAVHSPFLFDEYSRRMLAVLEAAVREKHPYVDTESAVYVVGGDRVYPLGNAHAAELMRLCMEKNGTVTVSGQTYPCVDGNPPVELSVQSTDGGAFLSMKSLKTLTVIPQAILLADKTVWFCTEEFQNAVMPFLSGLDAFGDTEGLPVKRFLAEEDFGRFSVYVLPVLKKHISVVEKDIDFAAYLPKTPEFCFYLSAAEQDGVLLKAQVSYGEEALPLETAGKEYRNTQAEKPVIALVSEYFPHTSGGTYRAAYGEDEIYSVLTEGMDRLREAGSVFVDESLRTLRLAPPPAAHVGVALHGDLIDIEVESAGYDAAEINAILGAYKLKKKYCRLKSGEYLSLGESGLAVVAELGEDLGLRFDENGKAQAAAFRASYINSVLNKEDSQVDLSRDRAFTEQVRALKNYRDEEYEIPKALKARLRGYQKNGYRWLCALSACGLGGILADDMGLGKTVQMLAYFLRSGKRFLVVCPASLIYNWESECKRFAPSITCHILRGTAAEREAAFANSEGLFITSYDQLRRDIEIYENEQFDCCVLDEAQFIRNAGTKAARAVKKIHAPHRFALTGTPIENRLSDLWSVFDFLMPGYLFGYNEFKSRIEQPAVNGSKEAEGRLSRLTAPFILRRKKTEVLKELPDKQENVVYVELTPEQRKLYNAQEQALRLTLQKTSEAEYLHRKIEYLAALTRLRQICCTPELYLENYAGGSGKEDTCMELLLEGAQSGHKILVFSQFTGMLELLIERATQAGLKYLYLSGKNSSEQRRDMVEKFQNDGSYSVFFISLKAGGTGLNLTAADRVVHFDPWWNIAAEEQASDRTHRIGQKNKVLVTKLVCKDTVEERIIDLQERKRALSDLVMDNESVRSSLLDRDSLMALLRDN